MREREYLGLALYVARMTGIAASICIFEKFTRGTRTR